METLSNVTAARWDFEEETFSEISQPAKDFISQLLQKEPWYGLGVAVGCSAGAGLDFGVLRGWVRESSACLVAGLRVEEPSMTPSVCCSRRLPSAGALLHPWLQQPQPSSPKVLSKERIRQFLARRKWQVPAGVMGTGGWLC